jgi:hypothetical protein
MHFNHVKLLYILNKEVAGGGGAVLVAMPICKTAR